MPLDGEGIEGTFQSVFPIKDFNETAVLEFVKYELEPPKYDVDECMQRDMTYAAPLKVTLRLIVFEVDEETGARSVKDIKEQDVYMGDMPLMTPNGTFIVNGTERVIVSQMHRSPGVFFDHDKGKTHSSGKLLFTCRVIPYRGSWLDFEFDAKDIVFARIDRRRKLPVTTLLYALGMDQDAIMAAYYDTVTYRKEGNGWATRFFPERLRGTKPNHDLVDAATGEVIAEAGKKITPRMVKEWQDKGDIAEVLVPFDAIVGRFAARDIINEETGLIWAEAGDELTWDIDAKTGDVTGGTLKVLLDNGVTEIPTLDVDNITVGAYIRNTMQVDKNMTRDQALMDIYRVMRPGEPPTVEAADVMFQLAVLRSRALRPLGRRPGEDEHAPRPRRRGHRPHAAQRGHHRLRQGAGRPARRPRRDRRHRPPRQPPGALGRRADGEPVPRRPAPHGARHPRAHVLGRDRHGDAAGSDQRQARGGGGARVLRLVAALRSSWTRPTRSPRSPTSAASRRSGRAA